MKKIDKIRLEKKVCVAIEISSRRIINYNKGFKVIISEPS